MRVPYKAIFSLLGLGLLVYFVLRLNIDADALLSGNPSLLVAALVVFLFIVPVAALRTRYFLRTLGVANPPSLLEVEFSSRFLYYVTPFRLNIPGKALLLTQAARVNRTTGISISLFEFALDALFTIVVALVGITLLPAALTDPVLDTAVMVLFGIMVAGLIAFFGLPGKYWDVLFRPFVSRKGTVGVLATRIQNSFHSFRDNVFLLAGKKYLPQLVFLTALIWVLSTFSLWLSFLAYGVSPPVEQLFVVTAIGLLVGMISQVPGGIGFKETSMVFLLGKLAVPVGVSGIAVLWSRIFTIVPILIGFYFFLRFQRGNPSAKSSSPHGPKKLE